MVTLANPSPQRYGITVQTWRIIPYHTWHIIPLYPTAMSAQLYHNALFGSITAHYTAP